MPSMETRSQRRQAFAQRPPYPQIPAQSESSSATSSAFQTSSSLDSISSPANDSFPLNLSMPQQGFSSAPLPSPSAGTQPRNYFGAQVAAPQQQQTGGQQHRIPGGQQQTFTGQRGGGGVPETAPFLKDFNLVAEAAKRAQMDCLMRDMGEVEL